MVEQRPTWAPGSGSPDGGAGWDQPWVADADAWIGDGGRPTRSSVADGGRRRIEMDSTAASRHSAPAANQARSYEPVTSRITPPPTVATAVPIWCAANTQPNTTGARAPKCSRHSARVGGTVATQSRP